MGSGPQLTLDVPAQRVREGLNIITVLELERAGASLELREQAELGTVAAPHVEDLI